MSAPPILLGANAFAARGEAAGRQARALASWRALHGVRLANLQWADERVDVDGFATHAVLRLDSRAVTGRDGPRKPVASEVFDRLAEIAEAEGCRWILFANADVRLTQAAVDRVRSGGRSAYAFSRMDVDGETGEEVGMVLGGVDAVAFTVDAWRAHRRRFRPYPLGEPVWDNVYTSLLLAHADGVLLNREPLVLHERHPSSGWGTSPYAPYVQLLAALDRPYFDLWARYHHRLATLRARGAGEDEEMALQRDAFSFRATPATRAVQALRAAKARVRYAVAERRGRA
ncbi:MAG TPA: hypothetical protein VHG91_15105 [Longimicrobium sp.]|nr:hypothetical protein [Longimicrobium sp.]